MQRRRSVPHTFEEKIAAEKAKLEAQVAKLKPGPQKDALLRKIRQLDTAAQWSEWCSSPELQPPEPEAGGCVSRRAGREVIGHGGARTEGRRALGWP